MDAPDENDSGHEQDIGVESKVEFEIFTDDQDTSCNTD